MFKGQKFEFHFSKLAPERSTVRKVVTPGIDWGYKNGNELDLVYVQMSYMIWRSKGTGYTSGQDVNYAPAEYFLMKNLNNGYAINISSEEPGKKWKQCITEMEQSIVSLKVIDEFKLELEIRWTEPMGEGFRHLFRKTSYGFVKGIEKEFFTILSPAFKCKKFTLTCNVLNKEVESFDECIGIDLVKEHARGILGKWIKKTFIKI